MNHSHFEFINNIVPEGVENHLTLVNVLTGLEANLLLEGTIKPLAKAMTALTFSKLQVEKHFPA